MMEIDIRELFGFRLLVTAPSATSAKVAGDTCGGGGETGPAVSSLISAKVGGGKGETGPIGIPGLKSSPEG